MQRNRSALPLKNDQELHEKRLAPIMRNNAAVSIKIPNSVRTSTRVAPSLMIFRAAERMWVKGRNLDRT